MLWALLGHPPVYFLILHKVVAVCFWVEEKEVIWVSLPGSSACLLILLLTPGGILHLWWLRDSVCFGISTPYHLGFRCFLDRGDSRDFNTRTLFCLKLLFLDNKFWLSQCQRCSFLCLGKYWQKADLDTSVKSYSNSILLQLYFNLLSKGRSNCYYCKEEDRCSIEQVASITVRWSSYYFYSPRGMGK